MWTASAHIITAVIGSGVLSLAWATAQLGWLGGVTTLLIFSGIMLYSSNLLADCYRSPDPITGKRNYSYMDVVQANLGTFWITFCTFNFFVLPSLPNNEIAPGRIVLNFF